MKTMERGLETVAVICKTQQQADLLYSLMKDRINAVKNLVIEHLEGGHHVHMEKPEAVGQLLVDFYRLK